MLKYFSKLFMSFLQNTLKKFLFCLCIFLLWGIFWWILVFLNDNSKNIENISQNFSHNSEEKKSFSQSSQVFDTPKVKRVYNILQEKFYGFENKSTSEIEEKFITAMVSSLGDKYTEFFNEEETRSFEEELSGNFQWIGAVVDEHELGTLISRVLPNSPAEKAWLIAWDIVVSVNSQSIQWMSPAEAVKLIRWPKWTEVSIEFLREWEKKPLTIKRDEIIIASVDYKILENTNFGYIQVNTFWENTNREFRNALFDLKEKKVSGIILDFRFNGGGLLDTTQELLSVFLPRNKKIVSMKGVKPEENQIIYTDFFWYSDEKTPLVVLVNRFSASASEIFAWALQEYNRAIIIGEKTYGKGSVQETLPLGDGSLIKVTTAKWYTPKDRNIDSEGIEPDVNVEITEEDIKNKFDRQLEYAKKSLEEQVKGEKNFSEIIKILKNL